MDQVTQQNAAQTEELSATAESLTQQADSLQQLVAQFKLDEKTPAQLAREKARAHAAKRSGGGADVDADRPSGVMKARRPGAASKPALQRTGTDGFEEF
jgi:methyl-accepting chemotaxis protein